MHRQRLAMIAESNECGREAITRELIYDVGMHRGEDTAYYLSKGYRVVAIEANAILAAEAQKRFAAEIAAGRLTILAVGIGPENAECDFWVNECTEFSSFVPAIGQRGGHAQCVKVQCVRFEDILREYGVPHYLKIDIERNDVFCLRALATSPSLPKYVSIEAHELDYLCLLHTLGYKEFKCIDQMAHNYARPLNFTNRFGGRGLKYAISKWRGAQRRMRTIVNPRCGYVFPPGSSGPFGEDLTGDWLPLADIAYEWLHYDHRKPYGHLDLRSWFDFHARLS